MKFGATGRRASCGPISLLHGWEGPEIFATLYAGVGYAATEGLEDLTRKSTQSLLSYSLSERPTAAEVFRVNRVRVKYRSLTTTLKKERKKKKRRMWAPLAHLSEPETTSFDSPRQDGRVVQDVTFRSWSPLEAWVQTPLLSHLFFSFFAIPSSPKKKKKKKSTNNTWNTKLRSERLHT